VDNQLPPQGTKGGLLIMTTAFDVAGSLLSKTSSETLGALKLQKLVFYAFGWYGHLTGEKLFREPFYALPLGPVVSPLLDAHGGNNFVSKNFLEEKQSAALFVDDAYASAIVDAVWESYGSYTPNELIEMTHCEKPWDVAWNVRRPTHARRCDLSSDEIVEHFMAKRSAVYNFDGRTLNVPVLSLLPDRRATRISHEALENMSSAESSVPASHAARVRELRRKFLISA
jgi:uncharacterized phage-associated protein